MALTPKKPHRSKPIPRAPRHLTKPAQAFWKAVALDYDVLGDPAGEQLLTVACESLDRLWEAQKAIKKDGLMTTDRYGSPKLNPAVSVEKTSRQGFLAAMRSLRLDIEPPYPTAGRPPGS